MWTTCFVSMHLGDGLVRTWLMRAAAAVPWRRRAERCECADDVGTLRPRTAQSAELGLADARRVLQHGLEHRLQFAGRAGDDPQHLGGRRLLLQRFAQLVEQPRVLDGDDGLGGEGFEQLDLLVRKWAYIHSSDQYRPDWSSFS